MKGGVGPHVVVGARLVLLVEVTVVFGRQLQHREASRSTTGIDLLLTPLGEIFELARIGLVKLTLLSALDLGNAFFFGVDGF